MEREGALAVLVMNTRGKYQRAEIMIRFELESYFIQTYHADFPLAEENAALGGLAAGHYRIVLLFNGTIVERWVDVEAGKLMRVFIIVE